MSFDTRCYDLALTFLPANATDVEKDDLAQQIQDTIENWFSERDEVTD